MRTLLTVLLLTPLLASAQEPRFEAASIKPRADGGPVGIDGARNIGSTSGSSGFTMVDGTAAALIRYAYPTVSRELAGGPAWIESDRYDVQAKAAGATTRAQREAMLRTLLAERFGLRARYETVQRPVYRLVIARADGRLGQGLTRSNEDCNAIRAARARGELPPRPPTEGVAPCSWGYAPSNFASRGVALSELARILSTEVGRVIVDATGLQGDFEFNLTWDPRPHENVAPDRASLVAALEEQLGLKLEPARGPVQIVVIDRIERPTPD